MNPIELMFNPESVAVVGASNDLSKWGAGIFARVLNSPSVRRLYPINKHQAIVQGVKAYPSVLMLPEKVDLVVIATPAPTVISLLEECGKSGIKGVIIISAGFAEMGEEGKRAMEQIAKIKRKYDFE